MARQKTAKTISREIDQSFKKNRQLLLDSMKGLDTGSRAYLDRLTALSNLERKYRQERAERGLDPVNLGSVTTTTYIFKATIEPSDPNEIDAKRQLFNDEMDRLYGYGDDPDEDESQAEVPTKSKSKKVKK